MSRFLRNPYVLVILTTVLTAAVTMAYNRTLESDTSKVNNAFYKTMIFGLAIGLPLAFVASRPEQMLNESFFENDTMGNFANGGNAGNAGNANF